MTTVAASFVEVTSEQFYILINQIDCPDHRAHMEYTPERCMRQDYRQWQDGAYVTMACIRDYLQWPQKKRYFVTEQLIDQRIIFPEEAAA